LCIEAGGGPAKKAGERRRESEAVCSAAFHN
jgi:hypothetical protein